MRIENDQTMKIATKNIPLKITQKCKKRNDILYEILEDLIEGRLGLADVKKTIEEQIEECRIDTPLEHLEGYRKMIALEIASLLMEREGEELLELTTPFYRRVRERESWQGFQLLNCYKAFSEELMEPSTPAAVEIFQHKSGFTPIEKDHRYSWSEVPLQPYHAELGVLLLLLAMGGKRKKLLDQAFLLARFQLNFLGSDHLPLPALYTREIEGKQGVVIGWNMLLYHLIGRACHLEEFSAIAKRQRGWLEEKRQQPHPLLFFIEKMFSGNDAAVEKKPAPLMATFSFPEIAMAGRRESGLTVISTLHGDRTGMGCFSVNSDLSLVTFAPQHLPYDRCEGFGITYSSHREGEKSSISFKNKEEGFSLKTITKLTSKSAHNSSYAIAGSSTHSEVWLESSHEFYDGHFFVENLYHRYHGENAMAFVFYLKAESCEVEGERSLLPRTLDRYRGKVQRLFFRGGGKFLRISPLFNEGLMEVIPLAGDDSFWGCDFLVGFPIEEETSRQKWEISSESVS